MSRKNIVEFQSKMVLLTSTLNLEISEIGRSQAYNENIYFVTFSTSRQCRNCETEILKSFHQKLAVTAPSVIPFFFFKIKTTANFSRLQIEVLKSQILMNDCCQWWKKQLH